MASPAQIRGVLPETLPEDFVEWDEASESAQPVQPGSGEPGAAVGVVSKQAVQAPETPRAGTPSGNLPLGAAVSVSAQGSTGDAAGLHPAQSLSRPRLSSPDIVVQLQAAVPAIDELRFSAPRPNAAPGIATMTEFQEIFFPSLRANAVEITRAAKKKWPIIAGASAVVVVILAAAMIAVFNRGSAPSAKPADAPARSMRTIQQPEYAAAAAIAREARISSEATRRPVQKNARPSREQAQMMDDQLHSPTRLQIKAIFPEPAPLPPGGFAATDIHGFDNSNTIGAVFGSPRPPKVQIASQQVMSVASAVALGLLIQKTPAVYPLIAKAAHVSGTIVLAATISKTGNVQNLRVVSGPAMLRDSAVDAVRTWRFKPYVLNDQPMAIETTINLHFTLH